MTFELQSTLAFFLYLMFFGWIGWRRGEVSELILLVMVLGGWLLLQEAGSVFVTLTNFVGKFFALIQSGGLTGDAAEVLSAVSAAPNLITSANREAFLFLVWCVVVLLTFVVTSDPNLMKLGKNRWLGLLLGLLNGIVFAALLLPMLSDLLPAAARWESNEGALAGLTTLLDRMLGLLWEGLLALRNWLGVLPTTGWLLLVTLLLILIAWPMRGSAARKK